MVMKWVAELKEKTGRSLDEWCTLIRKDAPTELAARRAWLKTKHKFGSNTASWLAERADGQPTWDESAESYLSIAPVYVDEMFAGPKLALRPMADALLRVGLELGDDVRWCPCKTIIPLYRNHVIAQIKPATRTRIQFGFALDAGVKFTAKVHDTGGLKKKDRITHALDVCSMDDIDADLRKWLKMAYERDA